MSAPAPSLPVDLTAYDGARWALPGPLAEAAVVVIDVQRSFGDPDHLRFLDPAGLERVAAAIERTNVLVAAAREHGVPVVWVALEQEPDTPWLSSLWLRHHEGEWPGPSEPCVAGTPGVEWFGVSPAPEEAVVTKTRYSGFLGTTLAQTLTELGSTWFIACGLTSECCVSATVWDGFQLGWRTVVAHDATAAYDQSHHESALTIMADNVALVVPTDGLVTAFAEVASAARREEVPA